MSRYKKAEEEKAIRKSVSIEIDLLIKALSKSDSLFRGNLSFYINNLIRNDTENIIVTDTQKKEFIKELIAKKEQAKEETKIKDTEIETIEVEDTSPASITPISVTKEEKQETKELKKTISEDQLRSMNSIFSALGADED